MAIGRISTYAIFQSTLKDMSATQNELFNLQTQISSGLVSQDFRGIADRAEQFLDLEKKISKTDLYIKNNKLVQNRLESTASALGQVVETATSLNNLILIRRGGTQGGSQTFLRQVEDQWQSIVSQLNVSSEGRYLFSGASTNIQPVDPSTFPELDQLGVPDAGYYKGSNKDVTVRAQDNVEFAYNVRADDPAFQKIFAGLAMAKYGHENNDDAALGQAYDFVQQGLQEVISLQANVNADKVAMDEINSQHQAFKLYWQGVKEEIGNTDLVAASTQVAIHQGILTASFQAFARINSLRLADFLQ